MSSSRAFTYMHLANIELIEKQYTQFLKDPNSIEPSWRYFFEGMEFGEYRAPPVEVASDLRIYNLIDTYRRMGHLQAKFNPLSENAPSPARELSLQILGFEEKELEKPFPTCGLLQEKTAPLRQIIAVLEEIYCGSIGIEYMGCHSLDLEKWVQDRIEPTRFRPNFSVERKSSILHQLNKSELFEIFIHTKYVGQKRFSLEGGETLIPILSEIIELGANLGMDEFVIGMAHRGRLNVLTNILNKSYSMVFSEFEDYLDPNLIERTGDVKYHKGYSSNVIIGKDKQVHISLTANPSHLESVNPVVEGKVRAKQTQREDGEKKQVVPILIHGDASFAGQGIVYETVQLNAIPGYATGGTIHVVVNNQIGFTTLPGESRSTSYCTAIAKSFECPVFHVNTEDPEGCVFATQLAVEIRQRFHCDVFIELTCYRKYGHNESDEPSFTQPLQYQIIRKKKSVREIYRDALIKEGVVERQKALDLEEEFKKGLHYELEELKIKKENQLEEAFQGVWKEYRKATKEELFEPISTHVDRQTLQQVGRMSCQIPEGFTFHNTLKRLIERRLKMVEGEAPIDWAMGEYLAFGTLLWEETHIRLSGQDSQRGTFTQRHAVWVDQKTGKRYFPLAHLKAEQGLFTVYNSSLSEYAILGFEFGYSLAYPSALVIWEAQFGDFANGGQIIFDQYLSCSEQKWQRFSGLVVLLPHGYEGQGPEHSSARMERFLQISGEDNIQVTYPTTPAQYFHLLRRQVKRGIRVPLVIFTPKGLLRHPACVSKIEDLTEGTFQEILDDPQKNGKSTHLMFCTGRIYYDLIEEREKRNLHNVAIIRLEQLYPLHHDKLVQLLKKYKQVKKYYWVQEEPKNMGAYAYIAPLLEEIVSEKLTYVGRRRSASTAAGSHSRHEKEHEQLMNMAFE
ncbi:MAG: 2-oxoglutarate dehydrogenase E1 component [Chlamydiales bacterium]